MEGPTCPLCGNRAESSEPLYSKEGGVRTAAKIRCRTCGTYGITWMQREGFVRGFATNEAVRATLSAATRNASESDEWLELSSETIPLLIARAPKVDPVEASKLLLEYLDRHYTAGGKAVHIDARRDYPLVYAQNDAGMQFVVNAMLRQGLIERADKTDHPQYRITMEGYGRLRDLRAGRPTETAAMAWPRVQRTLGEIRKRLGEASSEEQCQAVGMLCRDALISLAESVYDAEKHPTLDGVAPSPTDSKRMLDAVIAKALGIDASEELRASVRATAKLANAVLHTRTSDPIAAAICVEATESVVRLVAILTRRAQSSS